MFKRVLNTTKNNSFFLFGARGTGKTTYLKDIFDPGESMYIDLLEPATEDLYIRNPDRLEQHVSALPAKVEWILIDEIQKVPRLLDVAHMLIEATGKKFVLTGSSGRKLKRGATNLLAGRAFVYNLHPFTSIELENSFNLKDALQWGTLPKLFSLENEEDKQAYLRAYSLTYLKEEIVAEQIVRKLDPFREFLEIAAQSNGKIINYANIAKDVGVDTKTAISYFSILEDTLIGFLLPPYHRSIRKQQRSNPKFYYFDTGVKRALERTLSLPLQEGTYAYGNAFEHFMITEIIRLSGYRYPDWRFSFLQTGGGAEIDLIIDRPGLPVALLEIKASILIDERDVRTVSRFIGDFDSPLALCVSRDSMRKKINNVLCLHWRDALRELGLVQSTE
jgi:uncharacterized protein